MDDYYLFVHNSYVLLCTECQMAFPPHEFSGQCMEFRMCEECRRKNPEIIHYLYTYIYRPQQANNWTPFQDRLNKVMRKLEILESDLDAFKNIYCEDEADLEIDRQAEEYLKEMLEKCTNV
ncbi:uncharacterized protein LOC117793431 [Drosophila innubila]|uniref:uncharacterized protein LOC117793431 n=1 Tax=Drosophila innubila TaxID=198719 RepID=UPI00148D374B|nr:uncharacterized protein LOC117793431 [Drosophila innubila]